MDLIAIMTALVAALNNIADAIRGNPALTPTTVVAGPGATAASATLAAKGGQTAAQTAGLEKARAAAAAKKKAADEAAAAQVDLDLLGGDEPTGAVTLEMLRSKGMEILKAKKQPEMKALVESLGATSLTTLAEDKFQEAYEGLDAILSL